MSEIHEILELAKTLAVVRIYFSIFSTTKAEVLCGFFKESHFGRYHFELMGDTLKPPTTHLDILTLEEATGLKREWVHGGGRHSEPDDFRWLDNKPFIATSIGEHGPNRGALGPYHDTCKQVLAMLILQMLHDFAKADQPDDKAFYETALLRLRTLANNINERQSENGTYPHLLFASSETTER